MNRAKSPKRQSNLATNDYKYSNSSAYVRSIEMAPYTKPKRLLEKTFNKENTISILKEASDMRQRAKR
jgi:hypothetical protein